MKYMRFHLLEQRLWNIYTTFPRSSRWLDSYFLRLGSHYPAHFFLPFFFFSWGGLLVTMRYHVLRLYWSQFYNGKNFTLEEQAKVIVAPRTNNELGVTKLKTEFPELLSIKDLLLSTYLSRISKRLNRILALSRFGFVWFLFMFFYYLNMLFVLSPFKPSFAVIYIN